MPHNLPISAITSRVMIRFINDDLRLSMHPFCVFVSLYRILSLLFLESLSFRVVNTPGFDRYSKTSNISPKDFKNPFQQNVFLESSRNFDRNLRILVFLSRF